MPSSDAGGLAGRVRGSGRRGPASMPPPQKKLSPEASGTETEAPETGQASGVSPAAAADNAAAVALSLPAPRETRNDSPKLFDSERRDLQMCEAAIDGLRIAFWGAGKALQYIRDGRLYREDYPTFEAYVEERWQMRRAYADKLIRAWPLAERLNPIGSKTLNEAQVRELLPVAVRHGEDAAATVYETVQAAATEVDGVKVTATVIKGAVDVVPPGQFDMEQAAAEIRAYVARLAAGDTKDDDPPPEDKPSPEVIRDTLKRAINRGPIRAAVKENPGEVRKLVNELLDEMIGQEATRS